MPDVFRSLILGMLFVLVFGGSAAAAGFRLEPCGYGGGGRFTALAVDPREERNILVGSDVAGVFKSNNGGGSFSPKGAGLEGFATAAIAFHPKKEGVVFLLTDGGLHQSRDSAESWTLISAKVKYGQRFFGSALLVFFDNALWAGTDTGGVFKITIDDSSPAVLSTGLAGIKVNSLGAHKGSLYAATARGIYRFHENRWNPASRGLPEGAADMVDLAAHPSGTLYAVEKKRGLYLLDDKTETWGTGGGKFAHGLSGGAATYKALALHPENGQRLFLATHPEFWPFSLLESENGGRSWKKNASFAMDSNSPLAWRSPPDAIETILISPHNPKNMLLADWWNLWRSTDGGGHWQQLSRGLQNVIVNDIKQHPREPDTFFMAVADNGLVKSTDGGKNWTRIMRGVEDGNGAEIELSPPDGRTMYFLLQPWAKKDRVLVYRSSDGGNSWQDIGFSTAGRPLAMLPHVDGKATNLELDPLHEGVVYVGTNGYGVFKTEDGGQHWLPVNSGLDPLSIKGPGALLAHPSQPGRLFAATQGGGLHMTVDGGKNWQKMSPNREFTFGMAIDPFNPQHLIAASAEKRLLDSTDGGITWAERKLPGDTPPHIAAFAVAFDPTVTGQVYVSTLAYGFRAAQGLYESTDGGLTFSNLKLDPLPRVSVNAVAVSGGPRPRLMVGFNGLGPYCRELRP